MIISYKYRYIFIKTYKVAGTSIEKYLSQFGGAHDVFAPIYPKVKGYSPRNYKKFFNPIPELVTHNNILDYLRTIFDFISRRKFWNHIPACVVKSRISKEIWNDYFKFCVERNPWDKTLSDYYMKKYRDDKLTFEDYIKRGKFPINYPLYTDGIYHEKIIVDYVAKYENLNKELSKIFNRLGIPFQDSLEVYAKSRYRKDKRSYQEIFSENSEFRDIVAKAFEKEIKMHEYTFSK